MTLALENTSAVQEENTVHLIQRSAEREIIVSQWASCIFLPKSKSALLINHNCSSGSIFRTHLKFSLVFEGRTQTRLNYIALRTAQPHRSKGIKRASMHSQLHREGSPPPQRHRKPKVRVPAQFPPGGEPSHRYSQRGQIQMPYYLLPST